MVGGGTSCYGDESQTSRDSHVTDMPSVLQQTVRWRRAKTGQILSADPLGSETTWTPFERSEGERRERWEKGGEGERRREREERREGGRGGREERRGGGRDGRERGEEGEREMGEGERGEGEMGEGERGGGRDGRGGERGGRDGRGGERGGRDGRGGEWVGEVLEDNESSRAHLPVNTLQFQSKGCKKEFHHLSRHAVPSGRCAGSLEKPCRCLDDAGTDSI